MSNSKRRRKRKEVERAQAEALRLLTSDPIHRIAAVVEKAGAVGEALIAVVLYIVATSRLQPRPLAAILKGASSAGKNWLARRVLSLFPKSEIQEITTTSEMAWSYAEDDFRHKVVYEQERNDSSRAVHPSRLLLSEGKLVHTVSERAGRGFTKTVHVARGPIAFISTTTKTRIPIDDETRAISLFLDESEEQTKRIIRREAAGPKELTRAERRVWLQVQILVKKRASSDMRIGLPGWFRHVAEKTDISDVRVRRYFPAFIEACKTVALLRSFQRFCGAKTASRIEVDFADFAITSIIFDSVFVESLHRGEEALETRKTIEKIVADNKGKAIDAEALSQHLKISKGRAYSRLREAVNKGAVRRANPPGKSNRKFYLPAPPPRFIPDPEKLFEEIPEIKGPIEFVHPLSGNPVVYHRSDNRHAM